MLDVKSQIVIQSWIEMGYNKRYRILRAQTLISATFPGGCEIKITSAGAW